MMKGIPIAATFVTALGVCLAAQQSRDVVKAPATGTSAIAGVIMSADATPAPIRRAIVVLRGEDGTQLEAATDDAGAFAFTSLPATRYSLSAMKAGYVPATYGSKRPGGSGTPLVVGAGQRLTAPMTLLRGSVITGTVRDDQGRPMVGVAVSAHRYTVSFQTGERTLQDVTVGSAGLVVQGYATDAFPGTATTDDRGEYRIFGLAPGEYVISATVKPRGSSPLVATDVHQITAADLQRAERLLRGSASLPEAGAADRVDVSRVDYVAVYHPGALTSAEATTITLGPTEERSGIDVLLRFVPTATIRGTLTARDGSPVYNAQVSVMDPSYGPGRVGRATRSNEDGEFVIAGVPPGRYHMEAAGYPDRLFGTAEITVEGRDISVAITALPGITMTGRIVFDGTSRAPAPSPLLVFLQRYPFATGGPAYEILPDGTFKLTGVPPGRYKLGINGRPPAGWVLRSSMVNGSDASDIAFDIKGNENIENVVITLTDRPAEISGVLQNAAGQPAPDYGLIVFPADPRLHVARTRRTQYVRPDVTGRFIVRDLPAGDYLISAVTDVENGQWNDPAFLAELAASSPIKISVAEGEKKVQDIRLRQPLATLPPSLNARYSRSFVGQAAASARQVAR